jgi:hypothetical protein
MGRTACRRAAGRAHDRGPEHPMRLRDASTAMAADQVPRDVRRPDAKR